MEIADWWSHVIVYYEELLQEGSNILPQLELAKQIAASEYAETIYPVSYVHALNLSKTADYQDSLKKPSISIIYKRNNEFEISYLPNLMQTHNITNYTCHPSEVWSLLESLFLRLEFDSEANIG